MQRTDSVRDALGNTLKRTLTQANGVQTVSTQTVDRWGNVLQLSDPVNGNAGQFRYNALDEKVEAYMPDASGNLTVVEGYGYDYSGYYSALVLV